MTAILPFSVTSANSLLSSVYRDGIDIFINFQLNNVEKYHRRKFSSLAGWQRHVLIAFRLVLPLMIILGLFRLHTLLFGDYEKVLTWQRNSSKITIFLFTLFIWRNILCSSLLLSPHSRNIHINKFNQNFEKESSQILFSTTAYWF